MTDYDLRQAYLNRGIWELWHDKEFKDYEGKQGKEVEKLVNSGSISNVILNGTNGQGKTMLMNIAMKGFFKQKKEVYVIDFRHLIKEYLASWKKEDTLIPHLLTVDYLGIDDLGKEFNVGGGVSSDIANATLDYVLRYRIQRKKSTWLTFNLALSQVSEVYNGHIASLMKRDTIAIEFVGNDYGDKMLKRIR